MRRDPTEFRERFKRWKAGERVYDSGYATPTWLEYKSVPAYDDGKTPEETYYGKRLPDVTIEAPKVNPYVYYDGFGNAATIDSNGRRVLHDARTFNPEGFIPLLNAEDYEKARLLLHKVKDPNHAYEFGSTVRDFVGGLITAPMFDVASEAASGILRSASDKIMKSAAKKLTKNYITSDYYRTNLIDYLTEKRPDITWNRHVNYIIENLLDKLNNTTIQFYKNKPFDFGLSTAGTTKWRNTRFPEIRIHPASTKNKYDLLETLLHELAHATDDEMTTRALNESVGILPKKWLKDVLPSWYSYLANPEELRAFSHLFVIPLYNANKILNKPWIPKRLLKKTENYILNNSYGNEVFENAFYYNDYKRFKKLM